MSDKRPPDLQALFDEIAAAGPLASIDEFNRVAARHILDYNARPQAELGGLSPDEMQQLMDSDWRSTGALRLTPDLTFDELAEVPMLADTRTLLTYVRDEGPVKETVARNLTRATVAALLPRLRMPARSHVALGGGAPAPLNEGDVRWLSVLRHTSMFAGLLARRKGLRVTARGRELLSNERAGELFVLLFETVFRKLDLRVLDRDGRHAALQATIAYSFYKLRSSAENWSSPETLAEVAWLASAKDPPTDWEASNDVDLRHWTFRHRVLEPLVQFGLLEERVLPSEERWKEVVEFRLTRLFGQLMRFEFRAGARRDPFLLR